MRPQSEFQKRIADWFDEVKPLNGMASRWDIAQGVFPERWKHRSGRGGLITNIDQACRKMGMVRLPPRDRWADAVFCIDLVALKKRGNPEELERGITDAD